MASIFTYDPDPPRVASPWLNPADRAGEPAESPIRRSVSPTSGDNTSPSTIQPSLLSETGVTKLEAEPQEGPTEYKLHLLLRQRRKYTTTSTFLPKSRQSAPRKLHHHSSQIVPPSNQSRQARLEQLTTQLLWRLQQSSPYHASSSNEMVIPKLPDDSVDLNSPVRPAALIPGLEESRGSLYEIGVADDGTLVGLTKDEMDESIRNLSVMAASLGCKLEVLRMVIVGDCEWTETSDLVCGSVTEPDQVVRKARLWVAEAFVSPDLGHQKDSLAPDEKGTTTRRSKPYQPMSAPRIPSSTRDQLRITLTGPTTSGKSTLLGTLSTGTLDNGRGKSRLSLLRHRHEVASGMTSAVSPELIGYKDDSIFNYTDGNIESWVDIHDHSQNGRLVFVADSAGHPRYRRTILRGLVGWAPHWTILCIAADEFEASSGIGATSSAADVLGRAGASVDLVQAHLELCLKMEVPLAIAITKLDLASRTSINRTISTVLTAIKARGRMPKLIPPNQKNYTDLVEIPPEDSATIKKCLAGAFDSGYFLRVVPLVITSAVNGSGVGQIHALFQTLPIPPTPTAHDYIGMALNPEQPSSLFHIDDTFKLASPYVSIGPNNNGRDEPSIIVSGFLRFGKLSVGDKVVLGPFPAEDDDTPSSTPDSPGQSSPSHGLSISHPYSAELYRIAIRNAVSASLIKGEWHNAHIISVRNLRLPVHTLDAGHVGSIGIQFDIPNKSPDAPIPRIRKGMVLAIPSTHMAKTHLTLQAASGLTASFTDPAASSLTVGSLVNIYVAAVRAAAKVVRVIPGKSDPGKMPTDEIEDMFTLESDVSRTNTPAPSGVEVTLELLSNREWIELGSRIVVLEGGSKDKSGLESAVGKVVEVVD